VVARVSLDMARMKRKNRALAKRRFRCFLDADGAVAVELAIVAPLLVLLLLGVADYGVLMGKADSLEGAARAGTEVAKISPSVTAASLTSLGLFPSGATPVVASVCTCVDGSWPGGATCPPGPFDTPCTGKVNPFTSAADPRPFEYVRVTATQSFSPLFAWASLGFPASLAGQAFTRTQ
jgi:Flp pilus assembly protein TadG